MFIAHKLRRIVLSQIRLCRCYKQEKPAITVYYCRLAHEYIGRRLRTDMNGRELMHASEIEMMQKLRERSDNLTRDNLNKSFAILDTN